MEQICPSSDEATSYYGWGSTDYSNYGLIPVKDMDVTVPGIDSLPPTYESRLAYDTYVDEFVDEAKSNE